MREELLRRREGGDGVEEALCHVGVVIFGRCCEGVVLGDHSRRGFRNTLQVSTALPMKM